MLTQANISQIRFLVSIFSKETIQLPRTKGEVIVEGMRHKEAALDETQRYDTRDYEKSLVLLYNDAMDRACFPSTDLT